MRGCGEHVGGVVFDEEAIDLSGQKVEIDRLSHDAEGMKKKGLSQKPRVELVGQENAGHEPVVLSDHSECLHAGVFVSADIEDSQVNFVLIDQPYDVAGGISQKSINASGLKYLLNRLGPGPVGDVEQNVDRSRL